MRQIRYLAVLLTGLFSLHALAADKIAVVDVPKAIFSSEVAKTRQKQLQGASEYAALQAKYDGAASDIKALQKEAESKRLTWSNEEAAEYQKKMEYLRADLELAGRKLQAEINGLQNSVARELQPKAVEALEELIKEEGVTVILKAEAIVFAKPDLDLTDKLTERLNNKTK